MNHSETQRILNIADVTLQTATPDQTPPPELATHDDLRWGEIASRIGAQKLGYNLTVIAPGKLACPFHNHRAQKEMFLILEGRGELLLGDVRHPMRTGDVIAGPPGGPETAHQIINTSEVELRFLAISTRGSTDICKYPESGNIRSSNRRATNRKRRYVSLAGMTPRSTIGTANDDGCCAAHRRCVHLIP